MKPALKAFRNAIHTLSEKDYMLSVIAYNIAPTLKGLKTASTVTFCNYDRNLNHHWNFWKDEVLHKLNIKAFELKETYEYITVLFYREDLLKLRLNDIEIMDFLTQFGYSVDFQIEENLGILKNRYNLCSCPHELGIFLGFPLEDVKTFIETPNKQHLLCGYWKVFHNKDMAVKTFRAFDEAKLEIILHTLQTI